jgi:hypothetical protein
MHTEWGKSFNAVSVWLPGALKPQHKEAPDCSSTIAMPRAGFPSAYPANRPATASK